MLTTPHEVLTRYTAAIIACCAHSQYTPCLTLYAMLCLQRRGRLPGRVTARDVGNNLTLTGRLLPGPSGCDHISVVRDWWCASLLCRNPVSLGELQHCGHCHLLTFVDGLAQWTHAVNVKTGETWNLNSHGNGGLDGSVLPQPVDMVSFICCIVVVLLIGAIRSTRGIPRAVLLGPETAPQSPPTTRTR